MMQRSMTVALVGLAVGVGRVDACGRGIFVMEALEESMVYWVEADGSWSFSTGIESTQVGDPLPHRHHGFIHRTSADSVVGLSVAAVAEGEDEQEGKPVFGVRDITEGRGVPEGAAEVHPLGEDLGFSVGGFAGDPLGGEVQSRLEIS